MAGVEAPTTEYEANQLVAAKKRVLSVKRDDRGLKSPRDQTQVLLLLEMAAGSGTPCSMRVNALIQAPYPAVVRVHPGISLLLGSVRLRCVHFASYRHSVRNGVRLNPVRGWGENQWTPHPNDHYVVPVSPPRQDLSGLLQWCLKRWNVEMEAGDLL